MARFDFAHPRVAPAFIFNDVRTGEKWERSRKTFPTFHTILQYRSERGETSKDEVRIESRWSKNNLRPWISFNHVVRHVTYNDATDDFSVVVKNLSEDRVLPVQTFDNVIVATGHFSVPNIPSFPGIDKFSGRVLHSHSFRNASHFKDKNVLAVGSSLSAEDIAIQCLKYGAKSIVCTWQTKPTGFPFPPEITERPLLTRIEGSTIHFKDGSSTEVDDIILCTGYRYSFPFLEDDLRLKTVLNLYLMGLYKGICWTQGGNSKLLYLGMQAQYYTFIMFDVQAKWAVDYITGKLSLPDKQTMESDCQKWLAR
ncbi:dimethylaniline monooxygenase [N-oxide-forming] 2-like [Orbicella faveolata]|uniref:dimethylaniline monooxygenase [N-oxide-forming] 2-like n=1 Tax=Orbicella faveolata TaxID=48498 RepID=UPI0009E219E8|nr:dimethylaniline monooxygenase [N-oxide-forming] 2-like [Orbicella faveolata]